MTCGKCKPGLEKKVDEKRRATIKLAAGFVVSIATGLAGTSMTARGLGSMAYYGGGKDKPLLYIGGAMLLASVPVAVYCVKKLHDLLDNNVNDSCIGK